MRTLIILSSAALALAACATGPMTGGGDYNTQLRRLSADCEARGGILAPTGQQSGRPQNDNVCKINAQPSPMTRR